MKILIPLVLTAYLFVPQAFAEKQLLDRVVAVVNDDVVTQSELDILLRPIYEEYRREFQGEDLYKQLSEIRLKILNQLIEDRLVLQKAEEAEIEISDDEVESMLDEFRKRFDNEKDMEAALIAQGMSMNSIRERLRKQAMVRAIHDMEIRSHVVVSPLAIQRYYNDHPDEFTQKDQIKIRSITIKKNEEARQKGTKDEEAWQLIQDLRAEIQGGTSFAELAKIHSRDAHAKNGGLGDWVEKGEMIASIDEIIFKLEPQEVSPVIETSMGYHLFQLEEKKEGKSYKFEEVRDQIRGFLFQRKSEERFQEWMNDLKRQAYISVR